MERGKDGDNTGIDIIQGSDVVTEEPEEIKTGADNVKAKAIQALTSMGAGTDFYLTPEQLTEALEIEDLTLDEHGPNPITILLKKLSEGLKEKYDVEPELRRASPIVTVQQNFDNLLFPPDSISRSPIYTRYIDKNRLLRTHTSPMIPDILTEKTNATERLLVCPGICYRRDVVDKIHTGTPHQVDIWRIKKGGPRMERKDLVDLIETILKIAFPNPKFRLNETNHPYTLDGVEVEVMHKGNWLEVLEAGLAHPKILENAGLDSNEYSGLASGFGLDRLAMLAKGITDLRILRAKDRRILQQMKDLNLYKEVSKMPPMRRDITVVVDESLTIEDISEKIRQAVGRDELDSLEEITIIGDTHYDKLPPIAIERLGAKPSQKNLLIKIIIRALDRTLTKEEADSIRNRAYLAVNESDVKVLI